VGEGDSATPGADAAPRDDTWVTDSALVGFSCPGAEAPFVACPPAIADIDVGTEAAAAAGALEAGTAGVVCDGSAACGAGAAPSSACTVGAGRAGRNTSGSTYPWGFAVMRTPK
jgi:hypothetical protein